MITIALDEGGSFEFDNRRKYQGNTVSNNKIPFVGGAVFVCSSENNRNLELARLTDFFSSTCASLNCDFPADLHYNYDRKAGNIPKNLTEAKAVKKRLGKKLPEFLQTCPNGKYYLYAIVTDDTGLQKLTERGISNLVNDNLAANRYEHMAYRVIENLLFFHPSLSSDRVYLELATRSLPKQDLFNTNGSDELGYKQHETNSSFVITSASSYKAALTAAMLNSEKNSIQFSINVKSIDYKETADARAESFLYLADTICSVFSDATANCKNFVSAAYKLEECGNRLVGSQCSFLYGYSDIDQWYRRAYKRYEQKDYFDCLMTIRQTETEKISGNELYRRIWFNALERKVADDANPLNLQIALEKLDNYLYQPECNVLVANKIQSVLEQQLLKIERNEISESLLFRFYRTKMSISNHLGDHEAALTAYKKCMEVSQYVSIEDYLELRNVYTVALLDQLNTEAALDYTKQTLAYEELVRDIKTEIYPDNEIVFLHFGKTLSQLGQCYAFCEEYKKASDCFEKALTAFGKDQVNRLRTLSYYLHSLIEEGNAEKYELLANEYFGASTLTGQFEAIGRMENASRKFAIFVYIKALYILYKEKLPTKTINQIIEATKQQYTANKDAHPWELIFKYCAFLAVYTNGGKKCTLSQDLMNKASESVKTSTEGIILKITENNEKQYDVLVDGLDPFAFTELKYMYR